MNQLFLEIILPEFWQLRQKGNSMSALNGTMVNFICHLSHLKKIMPSIRVKNVEGTV